MSSAYIDINTVFYGVDLQEVEGIKVGGSISIDGDAEGIELSLSGSGSVGGNLTCEKISISGSFKVAGSIKCVEFEASGSISIGNNVSCNNMEIPDGLKTKNIECDKIEVHGALKCGELYAREVRIGKKSKILCNIIGKSIFIGNEAEVKSVIGERVHVEKRAEVDEIRYVNKADMNEDSEIGKLVKIDRLSKHINGPGKSLGK